MAAGTATKIALNTLTTVVFTKLGRVRGDRMIDLRATNEKLHDRCLRILLELFPDLDRADADRRLHAAGDSLRAAVEAFDGRALETLDEPLGKGKPQIRPVLAHARQARTGEHRLKATADGFDLGEFGHRASWTCRP